MDETLQPGDVITIKQSFFLIGTGSRVDNERIKNTV